MCFVALLSLSPPPPLYAHQHTQREKHTLTHTHIHTHTSLLLVLVQLIHAGVERFECGMKILHNGSRSENNNLFTVNQSENWPSKNTVCIIIFQIGVTLNAYWHVYAPTTRWRKWCCVWERKRERERETTRKRQRQRQSHEHRHCTSAHGAMLKAIIFALDWGVSTVQPDQRAIRRQMNLRKGTSNVVAQKKALVWLGWYGGWVGMCVCVHV